MKKAYLRFYEELNDFLPHEKRKKRFEHNFTGTPSVKDAIESIGVPHTEVDMILVNGISVDFSYLLGDSDDITVYPEFESFDVSSVQHLRSAALREPKFVFDIHLGSLSRYMRMAGFDSLYNNNFSDKEIIGISLNEKRTIITRDRDLLKNTVVTHGYFLRSIIQEEQIKEIIKRFHLENKINPFTRCLECNTDLQVIDKTNIVERLPEKVKKLQSEFKMCPACERIYWEGSHYEKMQMFIDNMLKSL